MSSVDVGYGDIGHKYYAWVRGEPVTLAVACGAFWPSEPEQVLWLAYDAAEHWSAWANYAMTYTDSLSDLHRLIREMWYRDEPYTRMQYYGFTVYEGDDEQ